MFLCLAIAAQAQNPFDTFKQFSATIVMSPMPAGREGGGVKVYRSGDKMRTSMPGGAGYMIMDLDQHTKSKKPHSCCGSPARAIWWAR